MREGEEGGGGAMPPQPAVLANASRDAADAWLAAQTRLTRLQSDDLLREDRLRHWSLLVRHISDVMKLAFELAIALIVIAIVAAIAGAFWSAANDSSLVIEAFSVPPDLAARGLTGQAIAAQLQDRLAAMQAATVSARPAESYANNWGGDIKVEIPNTGVSIGDAYRYLAAWLGHQTHITGEVFRTAAGLTMTARAGGDGGAAVSGTDAGFDKMLQAVAERVYRQTQPYRYAIYVQRFGGDRAKESRALLEALAATGAARDRAWAYIGLGNLDSNIDNNPALAVADYRAALSFEPGFALPYVNIDAQEFLVGHDEAALAAARSANQAFQRETAGEINEAAGAVFRLGEAADAAFITSDFDSAYALYEKILSTPDYQGSVDNAQTSLIVIHALQHDGGAVRHDLAALPATNVPLLKAFHYANESQARYWLGDWRAVVMRSDEVDRLFLNTAGPIAAESFIRNNLSRQSWPGVALAYAMLADFPAAHRLADKTPLDCYPCVRNRAEIDAAEHNWGGANYWFGVATRQAPSIPLGWSQWGEMLLHKGDTDAAIAKFDLAHQKGPHFADPLELWGEALIAKNRSDLALEKFAEAARYAPNWGRLHLKWGEALLWLGRRTEARAQFLTASGLDLSPSDRDVLKRLTTAG